MTELRTLIESAYNTAKQGYYKDALEEFRFILKSESESRDALYGAAACAFRLAQNDLAEDYAARLLKKSPQDAQTLALRERILASGFASEEEKSKTLVQRMLEEDEDPFGVGTDKKVSEVIPEWTPLDVRVPNFWDLLDYGKTLQPGRLKILSVYGEAARLYRSGFKRLVWAGWVSLLVQLGILFVLVSIFSGLLVWVAGGGPLKLAVFQTPSLLRRFLLIPLALRSYSILLSVEEELGTLRRGSTSVCGKVPLHPRLFPLVVLPDDLSLVAHAGQGRRFPTLVGGFSSAEECERRHRSRVLALPTPGLPQNVVSSSRHFRRRNATSGRGFQSLLPDPETEFTDPPLYCASNPPFSPRRIAPRDRVSVSLPGPSGRLRPTRSVEGRRRLGSIRSAPAPFPNFPFAPDLTSPASSLTILSPPNGGFPSGYERPDPKP